MSRTGRTRFSTVFRRWGGDRSSSPNHVRFSQWFDIVMGSMEEAQSGRRTPGEAAADAIALMRVDVGDDNLVTR